MSIGASIVVEFSHAGNSASLQRTNCLRGSPNALWLKHLAAEPLDTRIMMRKQLITLKQLAEGSTPDLQPVL
jgi:hypothetical protein